MSTREKFAAKVSLAVSSMVIFVCSFDERDIREGLRGDCSDGMMIPLRWIIPADSDPRGY